MLDLVSQTSTPPDRRAELAEVLLELTAEQGLDAVSVREVAKRAGVSIGTVQHWFPTKDDMLAGAFEVVVTAARGRLGDLPREGDLRRRLTAALRELLPLDERRRAEAVVTAAFAARAAVTPRLRDLQAALLADLRRELTEVLGPGSTAAAAMLLAVADGLALHEVSGPGLSRRTTLAALDLAVGAALAGSSHLH